MNMRDLEFSRQRSRLADAADAILGAISIALFVAASWGLAATLEPIPCATPTTEATP